MSEKITPKKLRRALPKSRRGMATKKRFKDMEELIEKVKSHGMGFEDDLISFTSVLEGGRVSLKEYANAVMFVGYLTSGSTVKEAYIKVFPDRIEDDLSEEKLVFRANKFNSSKTVIEIKRIAKAPAWLVGSQYFWEAVHVNVDLMRNSRSDMVKHQAAKTLMEKLAQPEVQENHLAVDVNISKDESIINLEKAIFQLGTKQLEAIEKGVDVEDVIDVDIKQ